MLVLSRQIDESIHLIQDGVLLGKVYVSDIRGNKVRIGLELPPVVRAMREEISPFTEHARLGDSVPCNKELSCPVHPTNPAETATSSSREALAPPIEDSAKSITDPK